MDISVQRIYEPIDSNAKEGYRVLVDRLWPRGVSKQQARVDYWAKEIAPSTELRTWFNHKPERFLEFSARYTSELNNNANLPDFIQKIEKYPKVVLLYAAKDSQVNHVVVLRRYITDKLQIEKARQQHNSFEV